MVFFSLCLPCFTFIKLNLWIFGFIVFMKVEKVNEHYFFKYFCCLPLLISFCDFGYTCTRMLYYLTDGFFFFLFHFSNFRSLTFWSVGSYLLINSSNDFKKCNFLAVLFPAFLYHLFLYVPKRPCTSLVKVWGMAEPYNYDVTILEFEAPLQLFRI